MQKKTTGPALLLRLRPADKSILRRADNLFQGFHVSANLPDFLTDIVRESGKPCFLDPQTHIFTLPPSRHFDAERRGFRKTSKTLAESYGAPFREVLGERPLRPSDFEDDRVARATVQRVLAYQRGKLNGQMPLFQDPYYDKYRLLEDEPDDASPLTQVLAPPYFYFKGPTDPWFEVNVRLARLALEEKRERELIYPILLFSERLLADDADIDAVAKCFLADPFDGYLAWPNRFVEEAQPVEHLRGVARLVMRLAESGRRVSKLYGGYWSALLSSRGLRGFSCGLGYWASKNAFAYGGRGGGGVPQKFYIPKLHSAFEFDVAEKLLRAAPSLRCNCAVCADTVGKTIDLFPKMKEEARSELHFLQVRNAEMNQLATESMDSIARDLRRASADLERSTVIDTSFLSNWSKALAA